MKYTDLMIDIETLSTAPTACIVQIAAVPFNRGSGAHGLPFAVRVDPDMHRFDVSADTLRFWMRQSDAARQHVFAPEAASIYDALGYLCEEYVHLFGDTAPKGVWALPVSFDLPILENAFAVCRLKSPWPYNAPRCCRTLFDLAGIEKQDRIKPEDLGYVSHDAAGDCIAQIKTVAMAFDRLSRPTVRSME